MSDAKISAEERGALDDALDGLRRSQHTERIAEHARRALLIIAPLVMQRLDASEAEVVGMRAEVEKANEQMDTVNMRAQRDTNGLLDRVSALEAELAAAKVERCTGCVAVTEGAAVQLAAMSRDLAHVTAERDTLKRERDAAQADRETPLDALRMAGEVQAKYRAVAAFAQHTSACTYAPPAKYLAPGASRVREGRPCTCGLDAARKEAGLT